MNHDSGQKKLKMARMSVDDSKKAVKFPIFGINFNGSILKRIEKEFYHRVKTGLRQHVDVFTIDELKQELNDEQGIDFQKPLTPNDPRFDKLITRICDKINRCILDYNNFLKELAAFNEFDLLQYWKETMATASPKKGAKEKPEKNKAKPKQKEKDDEKSSKKKDDKKSNKSNNKFQYPTPTEYECDATKASFVPLITHRFSNIGISKKKAALNDHIDDHPWNGMRQYIIVLGATTDIYLDLLAKGIQFRSILHIFPTGKKYKKASNKIIENSVKPLKRSSLTKPVAIFTKYTEPLSECGVKLYSQEIYDQIVWSLYDAENLYNYPYKIYIDRFLEMPLQEIAPCIEVRNGANLIKSFKIDTDVLTYFNELLNQVQSGHKFGTYDSNELNRVNLLAPNNYESIFVEESNTLLKKNYESDLSMKYYRSYDKILYHLLENRMLDIIEQCKTYAPTNRCLGSYYMEPFSKFGILQRFNYLYDNCDKMEILSSESDDYKSIKFKRNFYKLTVCKVIRVISNKNCFRDFVEYTFNDIKPILQKVENGIKSDEMTPAALDISRRGGSTKFTFFEDFVRYLSIKHKAKFSNARYADLTRKLGSQMAISIEPIYRKALFTGYEIGDGVYQQLETTRSIYRFEFGFIRLLIDQFRYAKTLLTLTLHLIDIDIYFHPHVNSQYIGQRIRLVTNDDIAITLDVQTGQVNNNTQNVPNIHILWPNGFSIENKSFNLSDHDNLTIKYITQILPHPDDKTFETHRLFLSSGAVVIYNNHGGVRVLLSNGTIFEHQTPLHMSSSEKRIDMEMESLRAFEKEKDVEKQLEIEQAAIDYEETEEEDDVEFLPRTESELLYTQYFYEIQFIEKLAPFIGFNSKKFRFTSSTGRNFEVINGKIIHENHQYLLTEWIDYANDTRLVKREDGVRMVWSGKSFECYYEDTTVISTHMVKCEIDLFNRHTEKEIDPTNVRSSEYVAKSVIDGLLNILDEYALTICTSTFYMQHDNYATVCFNRENNVEIYTPNKIEIIMEDEKALIYFGKQLSLKYTENNFIVKGPPNYKRTTKSTDRLISAFEGQINFLPHTSMLQFQNGCHFINVDEKGVMTLNKIGEDIDGRQEPETVTDHLIFENENRFQIYAIDEISKILGQYNFVYSDIINDDVNSEDEDNDEKAPTEAEMKLLLENYFNEKKEVDSAECSDDVDVVVPKNNYKAYVTFAPIKKVIEIFKPFKRFDRSLYYSYKADCRKPNDPILKLPKECTFRLFFARYETCDNEEITETYRNNELIKGINSFLRIPTAKILRKRAQYKRKFFNNLRLEKQRKYIYFAMIKYKLFPKYAFYKVADERIKNFDVIQWFQKTCLASRF